jgi:PTH2 family peptidyl-tRNA hydrolase
MDTKQIIVIRKDLKMRTGKACAQASHASMSFLTKNSLLIEFDDGISILSENRPKLLNRAFYGENVEEINHWLNNSFRKICVYVNSQEELEEVHQKALDAGLISHLITDNGATEFNKVPTMTCCAIGPHFCHKFEGITDHLPLL